MLYPNCSEETFKLVGDVEQIRACVIEMLDIIKNDYARDCDKAWLKKVSRYISKTKKEVMAVKTIKDFENISIPYTINYETFFRCKADGELSVATCNNVDWVKYGLEHCEEEDDYWSLSYKHYWNSFEYGGDWVVLERDDAHNEGRKIRIIIERFDRKRFELADLNNEFGSVELYESPDGKSFKKTSINHTPNRFLYHLVPPGDKLNKIKEVVNERILIQDI